MILNVKMLDAGYEHWAALFDPLSEKLLGCNAANIANLEQNGQENAINSIFEGIVNKRFLLRLAVCEEEWEVSIEEIIKDMQIANFRELNASKCWCATSNWNRSWDENDQMPATKMMMMMVFQSRNENEQTIKIKLLNQKNKTRIYVITCSGI